MILVGNTLGDGHHSLALHLLPCKMNVSTKPRTSLTNKRRMCSHCSGEYLLVIPFFVHKFSTTIQHDITIGSNRTQIWKQKSKLTKVITIRPPLLRYALCFSLPLIRPHPSNLNSIILHQCRGLRRIGTRQKTAVEKLKVRWLDLAAIKTTPDTRCIHYLAITREHGGERCVLIAQTNGNSCCLFQQGVARGNRLKRLRAFN
mmetsp:Transcript_31291/g.45790  ORF Transcript_31291/g.45790 Transcript_31291/m.45790 type:complete len:202 (-) Transcript_31291:470-1075(-)